MKNNTLVKCLILGALAFSLEAKERYTVDQLILLSLEKSPDLAVSKFEYDASKSRYDSAFSGYLPEVNLNASAGHVYQDATFNQPKDTESNLIKGQLSLKQVIYDFGKTGGNVDKQKFTSASYGMKNQQKISNKKLEVKKAYYSILKAYALIDVQKENVKLNAAQLYRAQKYFEAGIRTKIDVSDAKVRLIQSKLDLKTAEYDLKLAYSYMDKILGFTKIENDYSVYKPELKINDLASSLARYDLNLHNAIVFAYENRYDIKKVKASIQASKADRDTASSEYYPSLYLSANYILQDAQEKDLQYLLPKNQWNAGINLDWNIYHGGSSSAKTQEKKINTSIQNAQLVTTKLIVKTETTDAYINVDKSKDTVELAQSLLLVSNEKFTQASKRYEHGLSDYIELQEARQGYINAKATLVIDYYAYYTAIATLDNAIGK